MKRPFVFSHKTSVFRPLLRPIPPYSAATNAAMRTFIVVFVLALITIAFEVYSDGALTSENIAPQAAPDAATIAVAHGLKRG
jgi:ABC-type xylose transport system permease subunit